MIVNNSINWNSITKIEKSKVIKILFKVFKTHFVFENLCILETVLNLIQSHFFSKNIKHTNYVIRWKIPFSKINKCLLFLVEVIKQEEKIILNNGRSNGLSVNIGKLIFFQWMRISARGIAFFKYSCEYFFHFLACYLILLLLW